MKPGGMSELMIYRGLPYCDLCGGPLAAGEMLCGLCRACRPTRSSRQRASRVTRTRKSVQKRVHV